MAFAAEHHRTAKTDYSPTANHNLAHFCSRLSQAGKSFAVYQLNKLSERNADVRLANELGSAFQKPLIFA